MTQTASSRHPVPQGPGAPGGPGVPDPRTVVPVPGSRRTARQASRRRAAVRTAFEGTPGKLRLAGIGAVLACLMLSLLGSLAFQSRGNALADARADAAQLIRVQEIATQLVKADSLFTNGYLAYGLESPDKLVAYDDAVSEASSLIAEASRASASDAAALATVNDELTEYTARVASARANNSQGYQVATGYLRQANVLLRGDGKPAGDPTKTEVGMLPTLQQLIDANGERVEDAYADSRLATWLLVGTGLLALGGLAAVQVWLARRTHRYLSLPLVGATVTVLLVLGIGAVVMAQAQNAANDVYDSSYRNLQNLANARIQAYTAKSAESISLIYRGTGGGYPAADAQYAEARKQASNRLADVPAAGGGGVGLPELAAWSAAHDAVFKAAETNWVAAAKAATAPSTGDGDTTTINGTFDRLDRVTDAALKAEAGGVDAGLATGRLGLRLLGWIAIVAGVLAAAAAWAGITQRLEEYR